MRGTTVEFTRVTVHPRGECAPPTWRATWAASEKGLRFQVASDGPGIDYLFGGKEWQQIR